MNHFIKYIFFITIFLGGLYFYTKYTNPRMLIDSFDTMNESLRCPNILIQKDAKFYLYNSTIAQVPGVNPIEFNNLEEYVEFLEWQRGAGIRCPVLYVQNTYDAQGNRVYKIRPSVTELQGGLPPTVPAPIPAPVSEVDQTQIQMQTQMQPALPPLPTDSNNQLLYSDNAMDDNWGGADYTQSLVDNGYYRGNEVEIRIA